MHLVIALGVLGSYNNTALAGAFHAIVDAIQLGHAMGLQLDTMLAFLKESPATTPMFRARIPKMTGEDDTVGFTIEAVLKDNALFLQAAEAFGVDLPELRHARQRLEAAIDADLGGQDPAALVRFVLRDKRD
jgi:3-hydroxyisobutyrate dehydrogenase-like beta-hydroxyacid dehydrogenase